MNVRDLKFEIAALVSKIAEIQSLCSHPSPCVTKEHKANTGNYDPTQECFWTEFRCELCEKTWTEEGSK